MESQLSHAEIDTAQHSFELILIADNLQRPSNYGMLIRVAESLGVKEVNFVTRDYDCLSTKMKRSSRSAQQNIQVNFLISGNSLIQNYRKKGYVILGLEYTSKSLDVSQFKTENKKIVLLLGNESFGLSKSWIRMSDKCIHLPMYGKNSSMNVVVASGIALWSLIQP